MYHIFFFIPLFLRFSSIFARTESLLEVIRAVYKYRVDLPNTPFCFLATLGKSHQSLLSSASTSRTHGFRETFLLGLIPIAPHPDLGGLSGLGAILWFLLDPSLGDPGST